MDVCKCLGDFYVKTKSLKLKTFNSFYNSQLFSTIA